MSINIEMDILDRCSQSELTELLRLTEEWMLPSESKFDLYRPNPVMQHFHSSPAASRILFGGNRSGKTFAEMIECSATFQGVAPTSLKGIMPESRLDPKQRLRLCTVDYPNNFSKVIWPYVQTLIPSDSIVDVVKDSGRIRAITNKYGGFIEFMMYESEVSKFQGASRHRIYYDEQPPQEIRDENLMRLVDTNGEEVFAMTPIEEANYGQSSPWVNDELFSRASTIFEISRDGQVEVQENVEGDKDIHVFFANIFDNQAIDKAAAERILSRFTKEEREVRTTGHLLFLSGLVYKEFKEAHLCEPFDDWWKPKTTNEYTLYIAIDPHPRTPHNVLFLCVRRDGMLFIVDEIFTLPDTAEHAVELIKTRQRGKPANVIIIDPLAYTRDPSDGSCFASDLVVAGLDPIPIAASKDKARGIMKVREALQLINGKPKIYVNRECKNFRYEITHYVWDSYKKTTANKKGDKQKPIDKSDHAMENFYRLLLLEPEWVMPFEEPERRRN